MYQAVLSARKEEIARKGAILGSHSLRQEKYAFALKTVTHTHIWCSLLQHPRDRDFTRSYQKANSQGDSRHINPNRTPTHKSTPEIREVESLNRNVPEKDTQRNYNTHLHTYSLVLLSQELAAWGPGLPLTRAKVEDMVV